MPTTYRPYYTLLVWNEDLSKWCIEFGDYFKDIVREELEDRHTSYNTKKSEMYILRTDGSQLVINHNIAILNRIGLNAYKRSLRLPPITIPNPLEE